MNFARLAVVGTAAIALLAGGQAARAETLTDALILGYRHSGLLEKNRAVLRAADEDVATALSQLRPIINYTVSAQQAWTFPNDQPGSSIPFSPTQFGGVENEYETSTNIGISANLLLYDGGQSRLGIDVAKETVLATRDSLTQVEQQVLFDAASAYLAVREAEAFVNLRRSNVGLTSEQLRASRERFDVGEVTRTDVALAESRLAAGRSQLAASLGDLEVARAQYVQAVGVEPGDLQEVTWRPNVPASVEAAQRVARQIHPLIRQDMRGITIAELNVLRAEAARRPTVSAFAEAGIDKEFQEDAQIGVQMTGPIYQGGQISAAFRQAIALRDESRADLHLTTDDVIRQVRDAWSSYEVAQASIDAGQLEVRASQVAFEGLQEELKSRRQDDDRRASRPAGSRECARQLDLGAHFAHPVRGATHVHHGPPDGRATRPRHHHLRSERLLPGGGECAEHAADIAPGPEARPADEVPRPAIARPRNGERRARLGAACESRKVETARRRVSGGLGLRGVPALALLAAEGDGGPDALLHELHQAGHDTLIGIDAGAGQNLAPVA